MLIKFFPMPEKEFIKRFKKIKKVMKESNMEIRSVLHIEDLLIENKSDTVYTVKGTTTIFNLKEKRNG